MGTTHYHTNKQPRARRNGREYLRTTLSLVLAFLVLFSSSSVMIRIHLCCGKVKDVALFTKTEACQQAKKVPPCHQYKAVPCCDDETVRHEVQEFGSHSNQISVTSHAFDVVQPAMLVAAIIPAVTQIHTPCYNYDPPLYSCDLTVAHHVFLI